jgi:allantoinase
MRLLVQGGTVVSPEGSRRADVLCEDERIAAVLEPGVRVAADELVDAGGLLVFPGFIDPHLHARDPGDVHKEDFAHATRAAAAGGVTTILVMPNAVPPVTDALSLRRRAQEHAAVAFVDFGLWGLSLGVANLDDIGALFVEGAVGVKLFWGYALDRQTKRLVYNTDDAAPGDVIPPAQTGEVMRLFEEVARADGLLAAHCEDRSILDAAQSRLGHAPESYAEMVEARPDAAEASSVAVAIELARATGARFHVVHISSQRAVELVRRARADGIGVSAETCPHYLVWVAGDCEGRDAATKAFPPCRDASDREALWRAVNDGTIASIGSDHAPHTLDDKTQPFSRAPAGMVAVETMAPLMLDRMAAGRLTPERLAWVLSEGTARLYGLYPQKGRLEAGADADLTLVDPAARRTIRGERLHSVQRHTPLEGMELQGAPVLSLLRGAVVMREGEPAGDARGRFVRPEGARADRPSVKGAGRRARTE